MQEFLFRLVIWFCYYLATLALALIARALQFYQLETFLGTASAGLVVGTICYAFMELIILGTCKGFDLNIRENDTDKFCVTKCKWYELCEKDYENKELLK